MYRTCLFCHGDLGDNGAIESFPVGRRLAFDERRGRLWVVCPACERWNLSPLEERWEAVEACERGFRAEPLRAHTAQMGLARLREGTELIRVGEPVRQEFAAWRYGDQLGHRLQRGVARFGGGVAAGAALAGAAAATGLVTGAAAVMAAPALVPLLVWGGQLYNLSRGRLRSFRVPVGENLSRTVFYADLKETSLRTQGDDWVLRLRHVSGWAELSGSDARRALGVVLPRVNRLGAWGRGVRQAAHLIEREGGPERFLATTAAESERRSGDYLERRARFRRGDLTTDPGERHVAAGIEGPVDRGALPRLPVAQRLALEMAVHEDTERLAMEDELRPLLAAWREAEEIAAIADRLTTPAEHERWIDERRASGRGG